MKQAHRRILTEADKYRKGDQVWNDTIGNWIDIDPDVAGEWVDPHGLPVTRYFYIDSKEKPDDIDVTENDRPDFDFASERMPLRILIRVGTEVIECVFDPKNVAPSGKWVVIHYANDQPPSWISMSQLDSWCVEILETLEQ